MHGASKELEGNLVDGVMLDILVHQENRVVLVIKEMMETVESQVHQVQLGCGGEGETLVILDQGVLRAHQDSQVHGDLLDLLDQQDKLVPLVYLAGKVTGDSLAEMANQELQENLDPKDLQET